MTPRMFLAAVAVAVYATYIAVLRRAGRRHQAAVEQGDTVVVVSMSQGVRDRL